MLCLVFRVKDTYFVDIQKINIDFYFLEIEGIFSVMCVQTIWYVLLQYTTLF